MSKQINHDLLFELLVDRLNLDEKNQIPGCINQDIQAESSIEVK